MKKILTVLLLFILHPFLLYALESNREVFPTSSPHIFLNNFSATNIAMGFLSGTANIWSSNEIEKNSNPATLGYQSGFSYEYTFAFKENIDYYGSCFSFGYKGVGISLPGHVKGGKWGMEKIYRFPPDENQFWISEEFTFYDINSKLSLGLNIIQCLSNIPSISNLQSISNYAELSLGTTFAKVCQEYDFEESNDLHTDRWTTNYGVLFRLMPTLLFINDSPVNIGLAFGTHWINPDESTLKFEIDNDNDGQIDEDPFDQIDNDGDGLIDEDQEEMPFEVNNDTRLGFSLYFSIPMEKVIVVKSGSVISSFCQNIVTYTFNYEDGKEFYSSGHEISFFDILFYRFGSYKENVLTLTKNKQADTKGLGIHLNYEDIISIEYNFASVSNVQQSVPKKYNDLGMNIDFIKLYIVLQ